MNIADRVLKREEIALFGLRELYSSYGYNRYKVSKFEEYDLYAKNKSFLISENILTFNDTDGRLMALKPDVTLSIIKNLKDNSGSTYKLYYNENVYRTSAASDGFREIVQTGLECIGNIDVYALGEVITLAQKSLELISADNILDISHMGFLAGLMENIGVEGSDADFLLECIGQKNIPAIKSFCERLGVSADDTEALCAVTSLYAPLSDALGAIESMVKGEKMESAYSELSEISNMLGERAKKINIDFSTVNDMSYYNGIIFKGFVNGIPDGILSGGRYDNLMQKMGKKSGAVGFAVYLDMLDRLDVASQAYDADAVVLYNSESDMQTVTNLAEKLRSDGKRVKTEYGSTNIRYRELFTVAGTEVTEIEADD